MKKLLNTLLIFGLLSTSAFASGQIGEKQMVDCIQSVQSGRYEGGAVAEDSVKRPQTDTGSAVSR